MRTSSNNFISFKYDDRINPKVTTCIIKDENKQVVAEASVTKYHKDLGSKSKSRLFALTKALQNGGFNKEQRTDFWKTFRNNVKN